MLSFFQILVLSVVQGACELLPVSSSAHVIAAEKWMHLDPSSPEMVMFLLMLHTGTMFAVIVYFWSDWRRHCFASKAQFQWFAMQILLATACTGVVGLGLKYVLEKALRRGNPYAEVEDLFNNLPLIAGALVASGILILIAGIRESKAPRNPDLQPCHSLWIGIVQGFCLPFRGFSRSGATISAGLLLGLPKQKLEEFSFALAVVLTPLVIGHEAHRLLKYHNMGDHSSFSHLIVACLTGMVLSFLAGLLALKWLSRWLEAGRWKFFGFYCLFAAAGILLIHFKVH